ncbi:MAG: hypothetical protein RLZZ450_4059 [Pseudomonadota bacterium]|jgi:uncharacterized membrane protein YcaP (DUF421 family)
MEARGLDYTARMKSEPYKFDLQRILFGDLPLWFLGEIVFRTVLIYLYTLLLVRVLGKRGLGQLSPFDFAIVIALGSAVGDPMFYDDVPVVHCIVVITVIVILQRSVSWLSDRSRHARDFIESVPRRLVLRGVVDHKTLRDEQLDAEELFAALRTQGIRQLGEVERAYIEPSGAISVLRIDEPRTGRPMVARSDPDFPPVHTARAPAPDTASYACDACGLGIELDQGEAFPAACANCPCDRWLHAVRGQAPGAAR